MYARYCCNLFVFAFVFLVAFEEQAHPQDKPAEYRNHSLNAKDDDASIAPITQLLKASEEGRVSKVVFSPNGQFLAVSVDTGYVFVWDTRTGTERLCLRQLRDTGFNNPPMIVGFTDDAKSLIVAGGRSVFVVDSATGETRTSVKLNASIVAGNIDPSGACVAITDGNYEVSILPVANLEAKVSLGTFPWRVEVFAFSPDATKVALSFGCTYPDSVKVYDCASGRAVWEGDSMDKSINAMAFTRDSKMLLACLSNGSIRFLDAETGKPLAVGRDKVNRLQAGHDWGAIETTLDGRFAGIKKADGGITIVDLNEPCVVKQSAWGSRKLGSDGEDFAVGQEAGFVVETRRGPQYELLLRTYSPDCRAVILEMLLPGEWRGRGMALSADCSKCAIRQEYLVALVRLSAEQSRQERQAAVARVAAQRQAAEKAKRLAEETAKQAEKAASQKRIAEHEPEVRVHQGESLAGIRRVPRVGADPGWIVQSLHRGMLSENLDRNGDLGRMLDAYQRGVAKWGGADGTTKSMSAFGLPDIDWSKGAAIPAIHDDAEDPFVLTQKESEGTRVGFAPIQVAEDLLCCISFMVIDDSPANAGAAGLDFLATQIEMFGGKNRLGISGSSSLMSEDTYIDLWSSTKHKRYTVTRWQKNRPVGHTTIQTYAPLLFEVLNNEPDFIFIENVKVELPPKFRKACRVLCDKVLELRKAQGQDGLPVCRSP